VAARRKYFHAAVRFQLLDDKTPEKSGPARNRYALIREFSAQSKISLPSVVQSGKRPRPEQTISELKGAPSLAQMLEVGYVIKNFGAAEIQTELKLSACALAI